MLAVTGYNSTIVRELSKMVPDQVVRIENNFRIDSADKYVFAAGILRQQSIINQTESDVIESVMVNLTDVVTMCEYVLRRNPAARICIIGSESAILGSFDETYAVAKAGIHAYATWRKVNDAQTLAVISPTIIADSGMTLNRKDYPEVLTKRATVTAKEVAQRVKHAIFDDVTGRHYVERMLGT